MVNFYLEGGWGMYPVTVFGLVLLAAAVGFVVRPNRNGLKRLQWLMAVVLGAGLLGTVTGFIATFQYVAQMPAPKDAFVVLVGLAESLHNLSLSLMFAVLGAILVAVGTGRLPKDG